MKYQETLRSTNEKRVFQSRVLLSTLCAVITGDCLRCVCIVFVLCAHFAGPVSLHTKVQKKRESGFVAMIFGRSHWIVARVSYSYKNLRLVVRKLLLPELKKRNENQLGTLHLVWSKT